MMIDKFGDHNYRDFEKQFIDTFYRSKYWDNRSGLSKTVQDDMRKWQKKLIKKEAFHGTLVNLQNFCDAANLSPNDILLPPESSSDSAALIEYVAYETAKAIAEYLQKNVSIIKKKKTYSFPLIYSPREMILLSMEVYVDKGLEQDLIMHFLMTEFSYDTSKNNMCYTYVIPDPDDEDLKNMVYYLSAPQKSKYAFDKAYEIARDYFFEGVAIGQTTQQYGIQRALIKNWLPESLCHGKLFSILCEEEQSESQQQTGVLDAHMQNAEEKVKSV